ncbi:MAG: sigma-70 family RNA polymerase sigma factor [Phycisphaerales bacterium]|nr:sigma-70 family RNA polymerase sigma factor [Phycisphaerales bacterium]
MTSLCIVAPAADKLPPGQVRNGAGSIPGELPQLLAFIQIRRQLPVAGWCPLPGVAPSQQNDSSEISRAAFCGGGRERREQITEAYRPLVYGVAAAAYRRSGGRGGLSLEDLRQEGFIGLLAAIERFDASAGVSFAAYARRRILGAILDALRQWHKQQRAAAIELAARIRHTAAHNTAVDAVELADLLDTVARGLGPRYGLLLRLRLVQHLTAQQSAVALGLHVSRVHQMQRELLVRLKQHSAIAER